jgi:ABC-type transporter MlaC component
MEFLRNSFVVAALFAAGSASAAAAGDRAAEQFAGGLLQQTAAVLHDNGGVGDRLHQLVMQNLDARKTALFALGGYQRESDPQTINDYVGAFTDYITAVYEARLLTFRAFEFKVVTSMDAGQGDTTVITQARPTVEYRGQAPVFIWLRLSRAGGQYKIIDVQIAGMWVSIHEREDFARRLSANHADLRALTSYLVGQAAQIKGSNGQLAANMTPAGR